MLLGIETVDFGGAIPSFRPAIREMLGSEPVTTEKAQVLRSGAPASGC